LPLPSYCPGMQVITIVEFNRAHVRPSKQKSRKETKTNESHPIKESVSYDGSVLFSVQLPKQFNMT